MERPLEGKIAVITGSSRGIGKQIALKLAEAGANIVGNSVDPRKQKRVDEVIQEVENRGSRINWVFADISTEEGRQALLQESRILSMQQDPLKDTVDYLFLNAAGGLETDKEEGWAEHINVDSQLALVRIFRNTMNPGGSMIYETSLWAQNFGKAEQPPFYRPVAKTKFLAERRLRELIPGLEEQEINLGFLCGHIITGTSAHTLMSRAFPEYLKRVELTAEGGKFPTADDMGEAAVGMLVKGFKSGDTEYVGGQFVFPADSKLIEAYTFFREDIKAKLPMYGDNKLLVNTFVSPKDDELGLAKETGVGTYQVRDADTDGHFGGDYKDIQVFRAVDQIEAAAQTLGLVFLGLEPGLTFVPYFKGLSGNSEFSKFAFPGDLVSMEAKITNMNPQGIRGECEIKVGNETVSIIRGIELGFIPNADVVRRVISRQRAARLTG